MCQLILGLPRRFVTFHGDRGQSRCIAIAVLVITGVYAVLVGATLAGDSRLFNAGDDSGAHNTWVVNAE